MAYSARSLSTNLLQQAVAQVAHGFVVGDVVRYTGATYTKAQADSAVNSRTIGIVSYVSDVDHFFITQAGYVSQLVTPKVPGQVYYLSPTTAGLLTSSRPTTVGQYVAQLFVADSTTSGYYFNNDAIEIPVPLFAWNNIAANTPMVINNGYIINGAGILTVTLPAVAPVGSEFKILGSTFGWIVSQNAGQTIHFGNVSTTTGGAGSLASTDANDSIYFVCSIANTDFVMFPPQGNITVV